MRKTLLITLFALSFCACTKSGSNPHPTSPDDDKLLVESVTTSYTDGNYIIDYKYDTENHLIDMNSHVTGNIYEDVAHHAYTYDNQGNLTKSTITRSGDVSVFDYIYSNGAPIKVAYSQPGKPSQGHTIDITTANNLVSTNAIHTPSGESATVDYTYTNNNKVKEVNKSFSPGGDLTFTLTFDDEYGTKKNPYLYSGNKWFLPDVPFANKNELLKETGINNGPITVDTYVNTYNEQGYPTTVEATRTTTAGTTKSTITYKYKKAN
nr:hypothetical protein [Mucilaginibacter sp. L294]